MAKVSYYAYKTDEHTGVTDSWKECESLVKGKKGAVYKKFGTQDAAQQFLDDLDENKEKKEISSNSIDKKIDRDDAPVSSESKIGFDHAGLRKDAMSHLDWLKSMGLIKDDSYNIVKDEIGMRIALMNGGYVPTPDAYSNKPAPSNTDHVDIYVDGSYNSDTGDYGYGVYMNDGAKEKIMCGRGATQYGGRNVEGEVAAAEKALEYASQKYKSITLYHDYQGIGSWADHAWRANLDYTREYAASVDRLRSMGTDIKFEHVDGHTGNQGNEIVDKLAKMGCGVPLTFSEQKFILAYKHVEGFPERSSETFDKQAVDAYEFD